MGVAYAFNSILTLLVYGLILFPSLDNFVDIKAIQIFLSRNPVPTLLGDTYLSIHRRTQAGRGTILCCAQLINRWITSHLPRTPRFTTNPENLLWSKRLMALTPAEVVWYDRVYDKGTIIDSCGKFANVPLLGMEGGISYNPTLARRQFGYPMERKPLSIYLENVYYLNADDSTGMREQWVIDRAVQIGMPYKISRFVSAITPAPPLPMTFDTEKEYQERLAEAEREIHRWKREYQKKDHDYETVMGLLEQEAYDSRQKDVIIAKLNERTKEKDAALDRIPGRKKRRMDLFDGPHPDFEE
ncbi:transmembrane protein, putative [Medicago truncatula]|uniref:Transmembrane protein, putative n=1 Tax=Medicago truncatula TaxID=3880 RepID=A0A072TRW7_MEDTR|nr:transmembrane protein, putative [Medicago truncatula]